MLAHATGMSLRELHVEPLPSTTRLSFKNLNAQLHPPGRPPLFALRTTSMNVEQVIKLGLVATPTLTLTTALTLT